MKTKTILIPLMALLISGCAILENPTTSRVLFAGAVSSAIQYGVPEAQRANVAAQINAAGDLYNTLYGPEGIPTTDQFNAALERYLPNNPSKPLAETTLIAVYAVYYPEWSKKAPKEQLAFLQNFLAGAKAGAAPYLK